MIRFLSHVVTRALSETAFLSWEKWKSTFHFLHINIICRIKMIILFHGSASTWKIQKILLDSPPVTTLPLLLAHRENSHCVWPQKDDKVMTGDSHSAASRFIVNGPSSELQRTSLTQKNASFEFPSKLWNSRVKIVKMSLSHSLGVFHFSLIGISRLNVINTC